MDTSRRTERATAVIVGLETVLVAAFLALDLVRKAPALASGEAHRGGEAWLAVWLIDAPIVLLVLFAARVAVRLFRGTGGRTGAWTLVAFAGAVTAVAVTGYGNALWALGMALTHPERLILRWPLLYEDPFAGTNTTGTPLDELPSARLDEVGFWLPAAALVGGLLIAALLLVSRRTASGPPGAQRLSQASDGPDPSSVAGPDLMAAADQSGVAAP